MLHKSVAIDLRMLYASGIGTYLQNIIPPVLAALPKVHFYLMGDTTALSRLAGAETNNVTLVPCHTAPLSLAEQAELPRRIPRDTTLYWAPHFNIPLLYRGKLLVTVHDLFLLAQPQLAGGFHKRAYGRIFFNGLCRRATHILCNSQFTAGELQRWCHVQPEKVQTIPLGVNEAWFTAVETERPHNRPYLIYVGNVKPHKNLRGLLAAFQQVQDQIPQDLLIVGKKEGFITGDPAVLEQARKFGERVIFTGRVEDAAVRRYVAHADALIFPSFYEGFGFPPLEAMACGCPAIVSDIPPTREVCADAALYCDPASPASIAAQIRRVTGDPAQRAALSARGKQRAAQFRWGRCAAETAAAVAHCLEEH